MSKKKIHRTEPLKKGNADQKLLDAIFGSSRKKEIANLVENKQKTFLSSWQNIFSLLSKEDSYIDISDADLKKILDTKGINKVVVMKCYYGLIIEVNNYFASINSARTWGDVDQTSVSISSSDTERKIRTIFNTIFQNLLEIIENDIKNNIVYHQPNKSDRHDLHVVNIVDYTYQRSDDAERKSMLERLVTKYPEYWKKNNEHLSDGHKNSMFYEVLKRINTQ